MKTIVTTLFLSIMAFFSFDKLNARDTVLTLSDSWMQAMTENDLIDLDKYMAEDYYLVLIGRRDGRVPKAEWINNVKFYTHLGYENPHVITLDSTIKIISHKERFTVTDDAWYQPTLQTWAPVVDVWVKGDKGWQVKQRLVGDWALFFWWDRVLGFVAGLLLAGLLIFLRRSWIRFRQRRKKETPASATS